MCNFSFAQLDKTWTLTAGGCRVQASPNSPLTSISHSIPPEFSLFCGIECDILVNGELDLADEILEKLDYVIVSIHSGFSRTREEMTKRIIKAIEHPTTRILAHPTGRLLLKREGYDIDLDSIIDAAKSNEVAIEFNCNPMRLDMDWKFWRKAKKMGVRCSLNPDAHSADQFEFIEDGIGFCRKGWLESKDIINCWPADEVREFFRREIY